MALPHPKANDSSSQAARHWQEQLETVRGNQCHQSLMLKAQIKQVPDYTEMPHGPCHLKEERT